MNDNISIFTLGQVSDHVGTIVNNVNEFVGTFPGDNNLRDIGYLSQYGTRFIQHSGSMANSLYHLGSKTANALKAIEMARDDYGKFKRIFLAAADSLGIDTDPR